MKKELSEHARLLRTPEYNCIGSLHFWRTSNLTQSTCLSDSVKDKKARVQLHDQNWQGNSSYRSGKKEYQDDANNQNCKIVLVNSLFPFVPHIKVLANSWEGFLTLV